MPSADEGGISGTSVVCPGPWLLELRFLQGRYVHGSEGAVLSVASDSTTPWTVACQAPLSKGILQARILKWVAMPSSRGSSQSRDQTQVSHIAGIFFTI